ncbi:MAG: TRAP transporter fused permease subunit [Lachnospiraceae bacterium]|nr:TRAP transporter fused permease subunit [Lachnospiraceae bacterium]
MPTANEKTMTSPVEGSIRESRIPQYVVRAVSLFLIAFTFYCNIHYPPNNYIYRGLYLAGSVIMVYCMKFPKKLPMAILEGICCGFTVFAVCYPMFTHSALAENAFQADTATIVIFLIFLVTYSVMLRKIGGGVVTMVLMLLAFFYMTFGHLLGGLLNHRQLPLKYIISIVYLDQDQGLFGSFMSVMSKTLSIFMLFAAVLIITGLGELITAGALGIAGKSVGGPAKVCVFAAALMGMLTGSPMACTATVGTFPLPLITELGFKVADAASLRAIAGSGGNLMPPVMGVGAFLMSAMLGISYMQVCLAGLLPAILWYVVCFLYAHFAARKARCKIYRPPMEDVLKVVKEKWHLVLGIVGLVIGLIRIASAEKGAFYGTVALIIIANLRKTTRFNKKRCVEILDTFADLFASLCMMSAALGIFAAGMTGTGLHIVLGNFILGGVSSLFLRLTIAILIVLLLGCVVPVGVAYLAAVTILASVLGKLTSSSLIVHMFIFFIATTAPITPPVCMATYTAARIADSPPFTTGLKGFVTMVPLLMIGYALFTQGLMFGVGTPAATLAYYVVMMVLGCLIYTAGTCGYIFRDLQPVECVIAVIVGICVIQPFWNIPSLIGMAAAVILLVFWFVTGRTDRKAHPEKYVISSVIEADHLDIEEIARIQEAE